MRKRDKRLNGGLYGVDHPVGGLKTLARYKFPNSVKVRLGLRVKPAAAQ